MACVKRRRCSVRIGQFAKSVREFDAAGIDLEAFGDTRIGRFGARQRRFGRRILKQHRQTPLPQIRLDVLDQHLAEDIRPGVVIGDPHPSSRRGRQRAHDRLRRPRLVASRSIPAKRSNAAATVNSSGSANGSAIRPRNENRPMPVACAAWAMMTTLSAMTAS